MLTLNPEVYREQGCIVSCKPRAVRRHHGLQDKIVAASFGTSVFTTPARPRLHLFTSSNLLAHTWLTSPKN